MPAPSSYRDWYKPWTWWSLRDGDIGWIPHGAPPVFAGGATCSPGRQPSLAFWAASMVNGLYQWDIHHDGITILGRCLFFQGLPWTNRKFFLRFLEFFGCNIHEHTRVERMFPFTWDGILTWYCVVDDSPIFRQSFRISSCIIGTILVMDLSYDPWAPADVTCHIKMVMQMSFPGPFFSALGSVKHAIKSMKWSISFYIWFF